MRNTNERGDRHFMNSNEEYLDSLLKAVTNGEGAEADTDGSDKNTETDIENEIILDAPEWEDETTSVLDDLETENSDPEELSAGEEAPGEEKAFSDPGSLFFEGEETDDVDGENTADENGRETEETPAVPVNGDMSDDRAAGDEGRTEELEDLILAADSTEEVSDEAGLEEISDLLANAGDSDEEMLAMLGGVGNDEPGDIGFFDEDEDENKAQEEPPVLEEESTGEKKKKKKNKKGRKGDGTEEATGADQEEGLEAEPSKKGIFARFMDFLLEEDEDEEVAGNGGSGEASIDDLLMGEASDENAAILAEIDKENENKKSDKKEKKGKKGKKGKDKEASGDEEEGEEGAEEKGKKAKKEKKKKEKPVKENLEPEKPGRKISPKKIQATALMCLTVTAAIILIVHLIPPTLEKQKARDAYYDKDYVKVVEGFYGEKLSESDELMYNRAVTILKFQRKVDAYNNYMHMGKETEALNQLIEAINRYEEIYDDAVAYNIIGEIDSMYQTVLDALQNRYGLSISQALEIYAIADDFEYTLALESVVDGVTYAMPEPVVENPEMQPEAPVEGQPEIQPEVPVEGQPEMQPEAPVEGQPEMQPEEVPVEGQPEGEAPEGIPAE